MTMIVNLDARDNLHQFLDHYSNLSTDDRHNRFFHTMSPWAIRDWMLAVTERPNSHYFFVEENESGQFEGLVTMGIESQHNVGNVAVSVLPESRGKGLGRSLIGEAIDTAKKMQLKALVFECLMGDNNCQRLFENMGFDCKYDPEQQCLIGRLDLENLNG